MHKAKRFNLNSKALEEIRAEAATLHLMAEAQDIELKKLSAENVRVKDDDTRTSGFQAINYADGARKLQAGHLRLDTNILRQCAIIHGEHVEAANELDDDYNRLRSDFSKFKETAVTKEDIEKITISLENLTKSLAPMLEKFNEASVFVKYRKGVLWIVGLIFSASVFVKLAVTKW